MKKCMKMQTRQWLGLLLLLAMLASLCGCQLKPKKEEPGNQTPGKDEIVLTVGTSAVTYAEANIYLMSMREEVEALYGKEIWGFVFSTTGETYSELMKAELLKKITYLKLVCVMADEFGVALEADDILDVNDYTQEYMSKVTKSAVEQYGITEALVRSIYTDNVLAAKIYETITLNANPEYTDDDVRHMTVDVLFLSKYQEDLEGNQVLLPKEQLAALRERAETLHEEALTTSDFYAFAQKHSQDAVIEKTVGKDDLTAETAAVLLALKEGEVSRILEEENGYYIYYCKTEREPLASQLAEEQLLEQLGRAYFDQLYEKWEQNTEITINEALWESM